jgi:hypothetical protein
MTDLPELKATPDGAFRVLDLLEKGAYAPKIRKLPPLWCPEFRGDLANVVRTAVAPTWSEWSGVLTLPFGTPMVSLDVSGAYIAAASSAWFAHGQLEHTGPGQARWRHPSGDPMPGYYLIDRHYWGYSGDLASPLGHAALRRDTATAMRRIWVTAPTLVLLEQLVELGHWPDATVYDSWTGANRCRLNGDRKRPGWTDIIRDYRAHFIATGDTAAGEALKFGYSQAIEMLNTPPDPRGTPREERGKKNVAYRPDWYAAIHAQHHATLWRKMWHCVLAGSGPLSTGGVDEVVFTDLQLVKWLRHPKAPFSVDPSGTRLGTLKVKRVWKYSEPCPECGTHDHDRHATTCPKYTPEA